MKLFKTGVLFWMLLLHAVNVSAQIGGIGLDFHDAVRVAADFSNRTFRNDADFSRSVFQKEANFSGSSFEQTAIFNNTVFQEHSDFANDTFWEAQFYFADFKKKADFSNTKFSNSADFRYAFFRQNVDFGYGICNNVADFTFADFEHQVSFSHFRFNKIAIFQGLSFSETTDFSFLGNFLPDLLDFSYNSPIKRNIDFSSASFENGGRYSEQTRKWHYINLFNSDISKIKLDYQHFRLCFYSPKDDSLGITRDFILFKIDNEMYSSDTLNDRRVSIVGLDGDTSVIIKIKGKNDTLYNSSLSKRRCLKIGNRYFDLVDSTIVQQLWNNCRFRKYLFHVFPYCRFSSDDGFYSTICGKLNEWVWDKDISLFTPPLRDSVIRDFIQYYAHQIATSNDTNGFPAAIPKDEMMSIYEKVLKNFKDEGQVQSYQKLDIEYLDFRNGTFILPHIWNCYGYHKEWVFYWAVILLLLYTTITFCILPFLRTYVYGVTFFEANDIRLRKNKIEKPLTRDNRMTYQEKNVTNYFVRLFSRVWYSFIYTAVIFFLFSLKIDSFKFDRNWKRILGTIYVIIVYTTGLACIAYMANFALQK
jgi:uncharacterized protein YjbI with pentapeptide repeats